LNGKFSEKAKTAYIIINANKSSRILEN